MFQPPRGTGSTGRRLPRRRLRMELTGSTLNDMQEVRRKRTAKFLESGAEAPAAVSRYQEAGWWPRRRLELSGDVEMNPGPRWPCPCCGKSAHKGSAQCDICGAWEHLKCLQMTVGQATSAKEKKEIQCGRCRAEASTLPAHPPQTTAGTAAPSTSHPATSASLNRKYCCNCEATIAGNIIPLQCSDCSACCHKLCSGMTRWKSEQVAKGHGEWRCAEHGRPQNLNLAKQRATRQERCSKCDSLIHSRNRGLRCERCLKVFDRKCSALERPAWESALKETWQCHCCLVELNPTRQVTADERIKDPSYLRILQWNCDGLMPKVTELRKLLTEQKIDVCCLQETKLRDTQVTPPFPGYETLRQDRESGFGGGLMTIIRDGIPHELVRAQQTGIQELQHVRLFHEENLIWRLPTYISRQYALEVMELSVRNLISIYFRFTPK